MFEVGDALRGIGGMIDTVMGSRVRPVTEIPDEPCHVRADRSQFETAVVNMAVNACDAMGGEGTLTFRLACGSVLPAIRGHSGSAGPFARLTITDTGAGIPAETLAHVFEPFFTTKEVGRGTGLGLSQVFGLAKQSGGDVDVASRVGEGTTFSLYLPETKAEVHDTEDDPEESSAASAESLRVLVVEDNADVGRSAADALADLGVVATWAVNARESLDHLTRTPKEFDVVFSDVVMPGMSGLELARAIRGRHPAMPVILTSGYSHVLAEEGRHGFELLQKPYSVEQLSRVLRKATAQQLQATADTTDG